VATGHVSRAHAFEGQSGRGAACRPWYGRHSRPVASGAEGPCQACQVAGRVPRPGQRDTGGASPGRGSPLVPPLGRP
jgi:hypothetical protein